MIEQRIDAPAAPASIERAGPLSLSTRICLGIAALAFLAVPGRFLGHILVGALS